MTDDVLALLLLQYIRAAASQGTQSARGTVLASPFCFGCATYSPVLHLYTYMRAHVCAHTFTHTCMHMYVYTHSHTCMHMYVCTHSHTCMHIHVHTFTHMDTHVCTHTFTHMHILREIPASLVKIKLCIFIELLDIHNKRQVISPKDTYTFKPPATSLTVLKSYSIT